jgi:hypothetical protein
VAAATAVSTVRTAGLLRSEPAVSRCAVAASNSFDTQAGVDQLCVLNANGGNVHAIIVGTPEEPVNFPAWGSHPPKHGRPLPRSGAVTLRNLSPRRAATPGLFQEIAA